MMRRALLIAVLGALCAVAVCCKYLTQWRDGSFVCVKHHKVLHIIHVYVML